MSLELPRLSSAELVARFGDDETALRRYRMLAALLREGRPPGEVARTFGVSRESLRRLRHDFARNGLSALQQRKRGGGHFAAASPLAVVLRQELAADPASSAAVLWRRVQERLERAGLATPRSTFYRLLSQLRAAESASVGGQVSTELLREALGALAEDPPLALGRSDLALLLLPDLHDLLQRGRWLQRAMEAAIKRLRPSEAGPVLDDLRWRHYLIIAGEYEVGEKRAALQTALALSASTYSRAKREALDRLVTLLPVALSELPPPEPPGTLIAAPPPPANFEYEAELEQCAARLRHEGLLLIWGPAGLGKTDLAAMLASRLRARGQKVAWHSCRAPSDETSVTLLTTLAAALAIDGEHGLWNLLRAPEPSALNRRIETLAQTLSGRHWTVIIAQADMLDGEEDARVLETLLAARERRDLRLVVVARSLPAWADPQRWPPFPPAADLATRQVFLSEIAARDGQRGRRPAADQALADRVRELLAAVQAELPMPPSPEQAADLIAALQPIERILAELREHTQGTGTIQ